MPDDDGPDYDLPPLDEPVGTDGAEPGYDAGGAAIDGLDVPDAAVSVVAPTLPHNLEAEQALLGALLLSPRQFDAIDGRVDADDFFAPAHTSVFRAMETLSKRGQPLDPVLLCEELTRMGDFDRVGGTAGLGALFNVAASGAHVEHYARVVREKSILRRLIQSSTEIIERATMSPETAPEVLDFAEKSIFDVATRGITAEATPLERVLTDLWKQLLPMLGEGKRGITGIPTGFKDLDKMTTGLHGDELIIVAGRPSMGKTTFALNMLRNIALHEKIPSVFFSLEMSNNNLATNLMVAEAQVEAQKVRQMMIGDREQKDLEAASDRLMHAPVMLDETPAISLAELRGKVRRLAARQGIKLVMIDYLQLMTASAVARGRSREQEVGEISRGLKALAKELHIPVIALAQLSRRTADRKDSRPILSDLRESGAIEQDADVVMLIHRPEYYDKENTKEEDKGVAEIIVEKQRNGPTGVVRLFFKRDFMRFENYAGPLSAAPPM